MHRLRRKRTSVHRRASSPNCPSQNYQQRKQGDRKNYIRRSHEQFIAPPSEISGQEADQKSDEYARSRGEKRDKYGCLGAIHDLTEDVSPKLVSSQRPVETSTGRTLEERGPRRRSQSLPDKI